MCRVPTSRLFSFMTRARSEQNHVQSMQQFFSLKEHHATPMMKLNKGKEELFFEITQYNSDTHNARTLIPLWTHVRKPYLYEHLRRLSRQILEIDEVTTRASLSTGTSPTTECTMLLNPRIFAPKGVEPRTSGVTKTLVTTRLHEPLRGLFWSFTV